MLTFLMFPHLLSLPSLCEIVSLFEKRSVKPHLHNPHTVLSFIFCLEFVVPSLLARYF